MKIHIVQKGDTLWSIAKKYGVDFEELKRINVHISSPDMIMPGMKIKVPTDDKHVKYKEKKEKSYKPHEDMQKKPKKDDAMKPKYSKEKPWTGLEHNHLPSPTPFPKVSEETKKPKDTYKKAKQKESVKHQPHKHKMADQPKSSPQHMTEHKKHVHHMPYVTPMTYHSLPMPMCQQMIHACPSCGHINPHMMPCHHPMKQMPIRYGFRPHPYGAPLNEHENMYPQQSNPNFYK